MGSGYEIYLLAVFLGLIPAAIARGKGYNFLLWWVFGALLFIIALPYALIIKPNTPALEAQQGIRKCPHCAEMIKREATVCRYCGRESEAWIPFEGRWWVKRPDGDYWLDEAHSEWVKYEPSGERVGSVPQRPPG
jgi:hypothetical protein